MLYLIDGYNLLFSGAGRRPRDPRDLERARDELVHLLTAFHAVRRGRTVLVFDSRTDVSLFGLPRRRRHGAVEVRFAPSDASADAHLMDLIAEVQDAQGTTVVTSDRAILDAAAAKGVRSAGAREFWKALTEGEDGAGGRGAPPEPRAKRDGLSSAEVEYWMKEFGYGEGSPPDSP